MIIYSESFHVEHSIEEEWIQWVSTILIPEIKNKKIFQKAIFLKVVSHSDDSGNTYSLQCYCDSKSKLEDFYRYHADEIQRLIINKFNTKILSFKTELRLLETFIL